MDRRKLLLAFMGLAGGGLMAGAGQAQAGPATLWDELQDPDGLEDLPAEGAEEAQNRRRRGGRGRGSRRGGRRGGRRYWRGRGRYRRGPWARRRFYGGRRYRRRRRVCRLVRTRYGNLIRRCWWVW